MATDDAAAEKMTKVYDDGENGGVTKAEDVLFPSESFVGETYWADLPAGEKRRWVTSQQFAEDARERGIIWRMFKSDPLMPFTEYSRRYILPGMGLFTEGYVLFSIGNLSNLFQVAYPSCWSKFKTCTKVVTQTTTYLQVAGIIIGQLTVGVLGDILGRRYGMIQDAVIMTLGVIMLTVSNGTSLQGWVVMYAISQFIYGVGVGGEYPMTGATTCEVAAPGSRDDVLHRGRTVVLAFTMQGWGQFVNVTLLILLYLIFHGGGSNHIGHAGAGATWRVSFGFILVFIIWLLYYRVYKMKFMDRQLEMSQKLASEGKAVGGGRASAYDPQAFSLLWRFYWHRLIGTAGGWFCNDFLFYGNKIFQSGFIKVINPGGATVITNWLWNTLNVGVELVGYYMAAFMIDWKFYGRVRMQAVGFFMDFIIFLLCSAMYHTLIKKENVAAFQFLYFFSSFWNQFGPNCVSFLVAAEVFPASVRATGHGFSAAIGKCGALIPTIIYNYMDDPVSRFWTVTWFGLLGFIITIIFLPDTTGLDLREQERRWRYITEGRSEEYHGIAIHPRHLSWFEYAILKVHRNYDPARDDREDRLMVLNKIAEHTVVGGGH